MWVAHPACVFLWLIHFHFRFLIAADLDRWEADFLFTKLYLAVEGFWLGVVWASTMVAPMPGALYSWLLLLDGHFLWYYSSFHELASWVDDLALRLLLLLLYVHINTIQRQVILTMHLVASHRCHPTASRIPPGWACGPPRGAMSANRPVHSNLRVRTIVTHCRLRPISHIVLGSSNLAISIGCDWLSNS